MAKKVFVFLTFVALILLAAMAFSKPEPWEHQAAATAGFFGLLNRVF